MISLHREAPSVYIRTEHSDSPLHSKAFDLRGSVPSLCWLEAAAGIRDRHTIIALTLQETSTQPMVRRVSADCELLGEIRHLQYGRLNESVTQSFKRILLFNSPLPVHRLPQQLIQRLRNRREVIDKSAVVTNETKEHPYLLHRLRWDYLLHCSYLCRFRFNPLAAHNMT